MSGRIMVQEADEQPKPPEEKPPSPPASPERPPEPPEPQPASPAREAAHRPVATSEAPDEASDEAPAKPEIPLEMQKRLDRVTWEKYEAKRHADELAGRLAQIEREQQQARTGGDADPVEQAKAQLRMEDRQRQFNTACNEVFRKGQAEYQDFDDAVRALNAVGYGNRPDALEAIAALPDGHRVYRALAADLDNASRVLSLPPMAMAMEMARMAVGQTSNGAAGNGAVTQERAAPALTRAPEPLRTVGGTSRASPPPLEKTSMAEFIRRRDAEERRSRISR